MTESEGMVLVPGGLADDRNGKGGDVNFSTGDECASTKDIVFRVPRHWSTSREILDLSSEPVTLLHLHSDGQIEVKGVLATTDVDTYWRLSQWFRGARAHLERGESGGKDATVTPLKDPTISHLFSTGQGDPPGNFSFSVGDLSLLEYNGDTHQWAGQFPGQERVENIEGPTLVYQLFALWVKTAHEAMFGRKPEAG